MEAPARIVLDLDTTDDPVHGNQEGRFYHGYYWEYCYLRLFIVCEEFVLCARLRSSNIDPSAGALEEVQRIVICVTDYQYGGFRSGANPQKMAAGGDHFAGRRGSGCADELV